MRMDFSKKEPEFNSFQTNTGFESEEKLSKTKMDDLTGENGFYFKKPALINDN